MPADKSNLRKTPDTEKKMIRPLKITDLDMVMQIWLDGNLQAHHFIAAEYWQQNYDSMILHNSVIAFQFLAL